MTTFEHFFGIEIKNLFNSVIHGPLNQEAIELQKIFTPFFVLANIKVRKLQSNFNNRKLYGVLHLRIYKFVL